MDRQRDGCRRRVTSGRSVRATWPPARCATAAARPRVRGAEMVDSRRAPLYPTMALAAPVKERPAIFFQGRWRSALRYALGGGAPAGEVRRELRAVRGLPARQRLRPGRSRIAEASPKAKTAGDAKRDAAAKR